MRFNPLIPTMHTRKNHSFDRKHNFIRRSAQLRTSRGSQIAEFAAALALLTVAIIVPVIDFSVVPIRWMMAQETVKTYSRQLACCASFSEAVRMIQLEPSLETRLNSLGGIKVDDLGLKLRCASIHDPSNVILVDNPGSVPKDWLPQGAKGPCTYSLILEAKILLYPAFPANLRGNPVPGLTGPFPLISSGSHEWENLGRNPDTGNFYLNE